MASIVAAATAAAKEGEGVVRMDRGRWKTLPGDTVRYFAYGSNMLDKVIRRRKLAPTSVQRAALRDFALAMDHSGVPWVEPVFANVVARKGSVCYGAVLTVTKRAFARLLHTEGGGGHAPGYVPILVDVVLLDTGETVPALTLWTEPFVRCVALPSRRYRKIVADGAAQVGLPADYVQRLRRLPAHDASWMCVQAGWIFAGVLLLLAMPVAGPLLAVAALLRFGGRPLRRAGRALFHWTFYAVKVYMWAAHDATALLTGGRVPEAAAEALVLDEPDRIDELVRLARAAGTPPPPPPPPSTSAAEM